MSWLLDKLKFPAQDFKKVGGFLTEKYHDTARDYEKFRQPVRKELSKFQVGKPVRPDDVGKFIGGGVRSVLDRLKFPTKDIRTIGRAIRPPIKDVATIGRTLPRARTPFEAYKKTTEIVPKIGKAFGEGTTGLLFGDVRKKGIKGIPEHIWEVEKELGKIPFKFSLSALQAFKAPGKVEKKPTKLPILGEIPTYQRDAKQIFDEVIDNKRPLYHALIPFIEVPIDATIMASILNAGSKSVIKRIKVNPNETAIALKTMGLTDISSSAQKTQFRKLAHELHPDIIGSRGTKLMTELNKANRILTKAREQGILIKEPNKVAMAIRNLSKAGLSKPSEIRKIFAKREAPYLGVKGFLPEQAGTMPTRPFQPVRKRAFGLSVRDIEAKPFKVTKIKSIHPADQRKMVEFIDNVRLKKPQNIQLELDARRIAEHYDIKMPKTVSGLADEFDKTLAVKPTFPKAKPITKPDSLITEARKYKSAEEFAESQKPFFRATDKKFDARLLTDEGLFVSPKKSVAERYLEKGKIIDELYIKPDAKILTFENTPKRFYKIDEGFAIPRDAGDGIEIAKYAKSKGFDIVEYGVDPKGLVPESAIVNKNVVLTRSQLTDIYNKAKALPKTKLLTTPDIAGEKFVMKGLPKRRGLLPETKMKRELETARRIRIEKKVTDPLLHRLDKTNTRKGQIRVVRDYFNLTDAEIKSISRKDVGLMSDFEFKNFIDDVRIKADKLGKKKQAMNELIQQTMDKELNVENLRKAMKLPTMKNMTITDIKKLDEAIRPFQKGDEFLSVRKLETVDRTELKGIKTWREARELLAKKLGKSVDELRNIQVSEFDRFRYDTVLAEKNPFYKMMVEESASKMLISEAEYLKLEKKVFDLAKGLKPKGIGRIVPQQKNIREFMEAKLEDRSGIILNETEGKLVKLMTKEFEDVRSYLIKMEAMKMGKENYFTHIRRGILEAVKEDGIVKAVKEVFEQYRMEEQAFNILDRQTGEILAMDKFFKFAMHRTGVIKPTENTVKAFLTYMKTFKKKQALDEIVPLIDIYAQALTPKGMTKKGVLLHGNLQTFVKEWLNTKKGRHITLMAKQNGKIDGALRAIKMFTSLRDLGLNLPVSIASEVGEQVTTYQLLGKGRFALGKVRQNTKQGKAIIEKYRNLIGKNPWKELVEPSKEAGDRLMEGIFILFRDASTRANKTFLLGSLSKQEFKTGVIAPERLSALRTELGRYRMVEGMKSIIGSTPEGRGYTQYKTWAIPILRTNLKNLEIIGKKIAGQSKGSSEWQKSILELYREVEITAFAMLAFSLVRDEDDNSFIGQIMNKAYRESTTLIQALQPKMFLTAGRTASFITKLGENITSILLWEEYKTKEGLKGVEGIKRQLTPVVVSQLTKEKETEYEKAVSEQEEKEKEIKERVKPIYDEIQKIKKEDRSGSYKMYRSLSAEEKKAYQSIKRSEETKKISGREEEIYPIYLEIQEMKKTDYQRARKMYTDLSKEDRKVYHKIKSKLD